MKETIMNSYLIKILTLVIICTTLLVSPGCVDKMNRPNYETIFEGLNAEGVLKRMGEPTEKTENSWIYIREEDGFQKAIIEFKDGVVSSKSWTYGR